MKFGVVRFPGSNCDQDAYYTIKDVLKQPVEYLWHADSDLKGSDVVVIPGGFSYGDYLRCGAIARFAPIMQAVRDFADRGGHVLGICNGFQVLCESRLLPGALIRNDGQKFVCRHVHIRAENRDTPFTQSIRGARPLRIPVAHGEGKFVCDDPTYESLVAANRVIFRYSDPRGVISDYANPNGSRNNIAGIASENFNVLGLMPHPERASDPALGSADGRMIFESLLHYAQ